MKMRLSKRNKLGIAIGLFALALGASIHFTAEPYIATINYGGCVDTVVTYNDPGSVIGTYLMNGGRTKLTYPDTTAAEYGCAATQHHAVIPVDLYMLTVVFGAAAIVIGLRPTRKLSKL